MWLVDLNYNFKCDWLIGLSDNKDVIGWFKLNYNFKCYWLIELSDNKMSNNKLYDNNLASEISEN